MIYTAHGFLVYPMNLFRSVSTLILMKHFAEFAKLNFCWFSYDVAIHLGLTSCAPF